MPQSPSPLKRKTGVKLEAVKACGADWEAAVRAVRSSDPPDIYSASAAISTCAKAREWRTALELLRSVEAPDRACLTSPRNQRHFDSIAGRRSSESDG